MIEVSNISKQVTTSEGTLRILEQINLVPGGRRKPGDYWPFRIGKVDIAGDFGGSGYAYLRHCLYRW